MILVFGYFKHKRVFYLLKLFIFIGCNSYIKSECTISISKLNSLKDSNSLLIYIKLIYKYKVYKFIMFFLYIVKYKFYLVKKV